MSFPSEAPVGPYHDRHGTFPYLCSVCIFDWVPAFFTSSFPQEILLLAFRTIEGAAIPLNQSSDRRSTPGTRLTLPLKNHQVFLIHSRISIGINKIREACPTAPDGYPQHVPYRLSQSCRFSGSQCETPALRVDLSHKQGLAYIDITKSGHSLLIKKERLDFLSTAAQSRFKPVAVKSRAQWVLSQSADFRDLLQLQVIICGHKTKPAGIPIFQFRGISELDDHMGVLGTVSRPGV